MAAYGAVEGSGGAERGGEAAVTGDGAALRCPAAERGHPVLGTQGAAKVAGAQLGHGYVSDMT